MFAESSKAFIFQKFAVKFQFGLSFHAIVPQGKFTELCSSATVVTQSKSTKMWSSAAPFDHDLWYFRHRTNEHFNSMLFIRKNL